MTKYRVFTAYSNSGISSIQRLLKLSLYPIRFIKIHTKEARNVLDVGCGEGLLGNLICEISDAKLTGIDTDDKKVSIANKSRVSKNANFEKKNFFELTDLHNYDFIIINDFMHHHTFENQRKILQKLSKEIHPNARILIKEVGKLNSVDHLLTRYADRILYPSDTLNFRSSKGWMEVFSEFGFSLVAELKVKSIWPACRNIYVVKLG